MGQESTGRTPTAWHRVAAWFGYPVYVYLGGREKRFVPQMDVAAFPPRGPGRRRDSLHTLGWAAGVRRPPTLTLGPGTSTRNG